VTPDEKLIHAFLVADDILRTLPPLTGPNTPVLADARMPPGVVALGSANGSIVVKCVG